MILPNLVLPTRVNQSWKFSGIDTLSYCTDKQHFLSYPHDITYNFNSRGFRDQEWPDSTQELRDAIWCIGDSFTVGIGSPWEHTWAFRLSKITNRRVINVSMDGASNDWIARTTENIVQVIGPVQLVLMWSYLHRRESVNSELSDEDRRMHTSIRTDQHDCTNQHDWKNFLDCKNRVDQIANSVQFAVPFFCPKQTVLSIVDDWELMRGPDWPVKSPSTVEELDSLPDWVLNELTNLHGNLDDLRDNLIRQQLPPQLPATVTLVESQDLARDGHHFDLITADWVATCARDYLI